MGYRGVLFHSQFTVLLAFKDCSFAKFQQLVLMFGKLTSEISYMRLHLSESGFQRYEIYGLQNKSNPRVLEFGSVVSKLRKFDL